jgi:hypothetical protein
MLKKLWNDPVWSKVIAGAIPAVGALLGTYLLDLWPTIGSFAKDTYKFAVSATSLSNWVIGILGLLATLPIIILLAIIWQKIFPSSSSTPDWQNYITDEFFGLRWRWRYSGNWQIYDIHAFCPHCDFQVYAKNASAYHPIDRIMFLCESCDQKLGEFDESFLSLENKIGRFIQQKIRNGNWFVQSST